MAKAIIKNLDALWAKIIKILAGGRCERCYSTRALNSHHIFTRAIKCIRWFLGNGICLCAGCHMFAHREPLKFHEWLKMVKGQKFYNHLLLKKNTFAKIDLKLTLIYLKGVLKEKGGL